MKRIRKQGKVMKKFIIFKDLDMIEDEMAEIDFFEAFAKNENELEMLIDVMIEEGHLTDEYEIGNVIDTFELNDFEYCLN
jgi:hypothetical protein